MNYTRGKAGPVSRMTIEVSDVDISENGANSSAGGGGVAEMARGRLKAVEFRIQGKHLASARPYLAKGGTLDVDVRWTGGTAVTIVKVHGGRQPAEDPQLASAMRSTIQDQVQALFG
jgi:hypothetical protein